ncbi:MAG TPA: fumarylacetoacetate hydrolase family protein [Candidatus Nanoarchaeia archaeon]|nr:fumarylacetoacetate hydrolase family protein [Candidatus Nanoarchaeia archaeon]
MIGRFKFEDRIFTGKIKDNKVIVEQDLCFDTYNLEDLQLLPPTSPSKIICVGLNYIDHAKELKMALPDHPIIFLKPPSSIIGGGGNIVFPPNSQVLDYEAELAVVIGKRCKNVLVKNAKDVILGFTCFNDVTARDLQKIDNQWTRAKSFDTFAPIGPYIVESSKINLGDAFIISRVNGKIKQDSNINNMIFDVPFLIEFISNIMTLEEGDIIATGTPAGIGPLQIGDIVEIEIQGIGILKNHVIG